MTLPFNYQTFEYLLYIRHSEDGSEVVISNQDRISRVINDDRDNRSKIGPFKKNGVLRA